MPVVQSFAAAGFQSIWYWVLHVVVWTLACYRTLGVPHDMLLRARRVPEIAARVDVLAQLTAERIAGIHDSAGVAIAAGAGFVLATFAALGFLTGPDPIASAQLSGTGLAVPGVRITPATFSFGDVLIGEQSPNQKWTVKNTGGTTITVDSVDLAGGDAAQFQRNASTCVDVELDPGEFCSVKVRFRPTGAPGPRATQLVVDSDVPGTHAADLSGVGGVV